MCGIKIPQRDFALKMPGGGGAYARGGAYLQETTVLFSFSSALLLLRWVKASSGALLRLLTTESLWYILKA